MKRSVSAALMIAISVLLVAAGTAAASAAPAHLSTVPAGALAAAPAAGSADAHAISVDLDPGRSASRGIVVTNHSSDLRLTVRLQPSGRVAPWLTLSDVVETLEPRATAPVSVQVLAPANAIPGTMTGAVGVRVERAVRVADGKPVAGTPSASIPVTVKVNGAATAQVSIVNVRATQVQGKNYLEIQFQNVGATSMTMRGQVHVPHGHPSTYAVQANVPPLASTAVRIAWTKPSGAKGVDVTVAAADSRGDQASWSGLVGTVTASTTTPTSAPVVATETAVTAGKVGEHGLSLVFLVIAIVLAALWLVYEVARARVRRQASVNRIIAAAAAAAAARAPADGAPAAVSTSGTGVPIAVSEEQVNAVAVQLAALVGAIDRLTDRLGPDVLPRTVAVTRPVPRVFVPRVTPMPDAVVPVPAPVVPAPVVVVPEPAAADCPADDDDLFDWPTEEQLERFAEGQRAARRDLD